MSSHPPPPHQQLAAPARLAVALENETRLDPAVDAVARATPSLNASPAGPLLRGEWLGHAVHPTLTDLPLGLWTATTVLDLVGGEKSRPAARRLLGLGLLSAAPTAVTGWAEWRGTDRPAQRVGLVHAVLNLAAGALYTWSWVARRAERHRKGAMLALAGAGAAGVAGYLGGHLAIVRDVSSRSPGLDRTTDSAPSPTAERVSTDTIPERMGATMDDRSAPRLPQGVTGEDVVSAIAAQHAKVTTMVQRVSLGPEADRPEALEQLLAYLAGHEAVEEELIHPRASAGGSGVAVGRVNEENGIAQQIERLEELDIHSSSFGVQFGLFEEAVKHHAKAEELQELPVVVDGLPDTAAALIVAALAAHEAAAPTRHGSFAGMLAGAKADVRAFVASAGA